MFTYILVVKDFSFLVLSYKCNMHLMTYLFSNNGSRIEA